MAANPPPGWYPDPKGEAVQRYWNGVAWTQHTSGEPPPADQPPPPTQPLPAAAPQPQQQAQPAPAASGGGGSRKPLWLIPVAMLLAAAAATAVLVIGGDDEAQAQTVQFQEPTDRGNDPFTPSADVQGPDLVDVGSGPFGGTGSDLVCDRELLIRALKQRPDRLREWARVVGIDPDARSVARYIRRLRPVTLVQDTRVTNHTFSGGRAQPFQAILQAGTAVLVDDQGVPRARCRCGNPLTEEIFIREPKCTGCPPNYKPPPPCDPYSKCWKRYPHPPPVHGGGVDREPPATPAGEEDPSASFSPNPGRAGDAFTLSVSGFAPNASIAFTLTRPDGVTEDYTIDTNASGSGSYFFPGDSTVITGTYTAVIRNPRTGAETTASVQVDPAGGGGGSREPEVPGEESDLPVCDPVDPHPPCREE